MKQSLRLLATAARRRCTGESHQSLAGLTDGTPLAIPWAASREQAELETSVFLRVCGVGSMTPHPAGIVRVRPEPDRLSVRLVDEPYVVQYWAERILPVVHDTAVDPRDGITGVYGVRYRVTGSSVELYRPESPALIRLGGFNRRWWELAAARRRETTNPTFDLPQWTAAERRAVRLVREEEWEPAQLLSPLLRRTRATAGAGPCNNTSTWFNDFALRVETTFGPPCAEMTALLCQGPTALGWTMERERCVCHMSGYVGSCVIEFSAPGQPPIHYSNLRWDPDDLSTDPRASIAELNARAFRP